MILNFAFPHRSHVLLLAMGFTLLACTEDLSLTNPNLDGGGTTDGGTFAHTLFVAHEGVVASYEIATGQQRAGEIQGSESPVDMQALADGNLLVDLTARNEILVFEGLTMLETRRIPSSASGATRPVHSYITPDRDGKRYWLSLNDGEQGLVATNSARFVDLAASSPTYLTAVGEVGLGIGHHKASFSTTKSRVAISNISDCDNVISVYDYSDIANIKLLETLTSAELGYDGSTRDKTCDPSFMNGAPPAPHGCATSKLSGKAYCNATSPGIVVAIDIDADPPAFKLIPTHGSGAGYTKTSRDGKYVYSLQEKPREADLMNPGAICQIGQLVVVDATTDTLVKEVPLLYKGAGCAESIAAGDEKTANPGHIVLSKDGMTMFVATAGGFGLADARVRQELVLDITNPGNPEQLASVATGASTGHHADVISGDGKFVFVADNTDGTVTQIDVATRAAVRTIKVKDTPLALSTFGSAEGPSEQTGPIH